MLHHTTTIDHPSMLERPKTELTSNPPNADSWRVAYIMSRFPKLTETFVLFEMLALEKHGVRVEVFPLLRARNTETHPEGAGMWTKFKELFRRPAGGAVMHPEAREFVSRAYFLPFFNFAIAGSQVHFLLRKPVTYFSVLWTLIRSNWGSVNFLLGSLAVFPKCVHFARCMQGLGVQHIHAHFANHPAAAAFITSQLSGIPYSFTGHGADLQVDQHMLREKVAAAKYVVAISEDNKRFIETVCGPEAAERVSVIHCGVDTGIFDGTRRTDPGSEQPLQIACVGTLYEVKGHAYLVEACRLLSERNVPTTCYLVGDGPLREALEDQARDAGLAESIHFLGRQTRSQIAELLKRADVLVAASVPASDGRREGIPVVLMEAMASGVPVVASRLSGIPELVTDRETGWLVSPRDASDLADALEKLSVDPALRQGLGQAGRDKVQNEFDLDKNAKRLLNLFFGEERP